MSKPFWPATALNNVRLHFDLSNHHAVSRRSFGYRTISASSKPVTAVVSLLRHFVLKPEALAELLMDSAPRRQQIEVFAEFDAIMSTGHVDGQCRAERACRRHRAGDDAQVAAGRFNFFAAGLPDIPEA